MPWPSTSNACGVEDGLSKSKVTVPDLALSVLVVNLSAPPGSASTLTVLPPPPPPLVLLVLLLLVGVGVAVFSLLLLLDPPQPESTSATATAAHAMSRIEGSLSVSTMLASAFRLSDRRGPRP